MKKTVLALLLSLSSMSGLIAQNDFSATVGLSLPLGAFAENDLAMGSGGALSGLNVNAVHRLHIIQETLMWRNRLGFHWNAIDQIRLGNFDRLFNDADENASNYFFIPLETGLEAGLALGQKFRGSVLAGFSFSYMQLSDWEIAANRRVEFDPAFAAGFHAGLEFTFAEHYLLGVHYQYLGDFTSDAQAIGLDPTNSKFEHKQEAQNLSIRLGYRF